MIRYLGSVVETERKEKVIAPESRFESIDMAYPSERSHCSGGSQNRSM
ncbi:MAG: hypothetical protein AAE977_03190 [Thermoplasmataceae archaeon]